VRGWGWRYAGRKAWACRGVDIEVSRGERVLLIGASGSGKSTLLRGVAGLLDPESSAAEEGTIEIAGRPAAQARDHVGTLLQDPEASLVMSRAGDDVAFGLENAGVPRTEIWPRVDAAMKLVGFDYPRSRSTTQLSGGEQQRLALAGALVREPSVLILDEPTANLDPAGRDLVLGAIAESTRESDTALIIVEHRVGEVIDLVDRVVVLGPEGGVIDDGAPSAVFANRADELAAAGVWVPSPWADPPARRPPGPEDGASLLRAEGLRLRYPRAELPAVDDVTLDFRGGQTTAITGPNGSGKSTLAMLLAGLVRPDAGSAWLTNAPERPLHEWPARRLCRRVGTVFQDPEHQFVTGTVLDELLVGPKQTEIDAATARSRAGELLERLRLDRLAAANPFTLSGGEKRRLSVAAALATSPGVLVLDEPTFGQDARTWNELVDLCAGLRDRGTAIIAVTHDEPFAEVLADRTIRMREGAVFT
jgi:energy-coupling factor transport system ATP-binding protein